MKRGFTLIELIFSMVIIAFVFTVIPKIIFVSNKAINLGIKEDALFNAMTLMGQIVTLPWDENNAENDTILATDSGNFPCNDYRVGGFASSRNCIDSTLQASPIARENEYNDIDDYHEYNTSTQVGGKNRYQLTVDVSYTGDNFAPSSAGATVLLNNAAAGTTNIKKTVVTVANHSDNKRECFSSTLFFYSSNLGHTYINKRAW